MWPSPSSSGADSQQFLRKLAIHGDYLAELWTAQMTVSKGWIDSAQGLPSSGRLWDFALLSDLGYPTADWLASEATAEFLEHERRETASYDRV